MIDLPNQLQNEQLKSYTQKFGDFVDAETLRHDGLTYGANAAKARDCASGTLNIIAAADKVKSLQGLLAYGFLGESFKELNIIGKAQINYEKFRSLFLDKDMPSEIKKSEMLDESQFVWVLAAAGRFHLQQNQPEKSRQLLEQAQIYLERLGNLAQYDRAVVYNDLD